MTTRKTEAGPGKADAARLPKTIVLADDDPGVRDPLAELLRHKGYGVQVARDGLEALRTIRATKSDYVILDIIMPKLDGSRVCAMIRQDPSLRHTPVIALSALSLEQLRRFSALSADAYVAKASLSVMAGNVLRAIKRLEEGGRGELGGGIFGYHGFRARSLVGQTLAARQHWETLVRSFPHGVLELDADGAILMANAEASRILGRQESRLIGEPFADLVAPRDKAAVEQTLAELAKPRLGEESRLTTTLGGVEAAVRLASAAEGGACSAILVTVEFQRGGSRP
jgi:PAS domain S-box-containing protein